MEPTAKTGQTVYELIGGEAMFRRLVDAFYRRVGEDPLLDALFPADREPGKQAQLLFLMQYFGGPHHYQEQRGHPRLRIRHGPFAIGQEARDAWVSHMLAAVDEVGIAEPARGVMREYFERGATFMINQ